jgi:hypothetical protein
MSTYVYKGKKNSSTLFSYLLIYIYQTRMDEISFTYSDPHFVLLKWQNLSSTHHKFIIQNHHHFSNFIRQSSIQIQITLMLFLTISSAKWIFRRITLKTCINTNLPKLDQYVTMKDELRPYVTTPGTHHWSQSARPPIIPGRCMPIQDWIYEHWKVKPWSDYSCSWPDPDLFGAPVFGCYL